MREQVAVEVEVEVVTRKFEVSTHLKATLFITVRKPPVKIMNLEDQPTKKAHLVQDIGALFLALERKATNDKLRNYYLIYIRHLELATFDLLKPKNFLSAFFWFFPRDRPKYPLVEYKFSFENVCGVLGVKPVLFLNYVAGLLDKYEVKLEVG